MFRVTQSPTFWSTVEIDVVPEDGGKPKKFPFDQQFPRLSSDEFRVFAEAVQKDRLEDPVCARLLMTGEWKRVVYPNDVPTDEEARKKWFVRMKWRGVVDEQDQPLEPSDGNIDRLLNNVGVAAVIVKKFFDDIGKAGAKNF